jgi:hypothetical protein
MMLDLHADGAMSLALVADPSKKLGQSPRCIPAQGWCQSSTLGVAGGGALDREERRRTVDGAECGARDERTEGIALGRH